MSVTESVQFESVQNERTKLLIENVSDFKEEPEETEYDPNNEADQQQAVKDSRDDIYDDDDQKEKEEETQEAEEDENTIVNSENFGNEFCAAIESVQIAAKFDREKMLENARNAYQQETGEQATDEMIVNALKAFIIKKEEVEDQEQEENIDADAEEEEANNNVDAEENDIDVDDFEKEMNLALDNVRKLGTKHQEVLVNKISATYVEYNGVEPTINDLSAIFGRIKQKFADEAADDFLDFGDAENDDDSDYDPNDAEDIKQGQQDQAEDF
jgi:hypothetical protein